jgi:hypothetical protein
MICRPSWAVPAWRKPSCRRRRGGTRTPSRPCRPSCATYDRLATADAARENLQQRLSAIEAAYADERSARQQAERAQRDAEAGRTVAERRLRQLDLTAGEPVERTARWPGRPVKATNATTPAKPRDMARRGEAQPLAGLPEPEPVQWWLTSVKKTQRR